MAGFTLVELLVVISIIAILSALVLSGMYASQEAARARRTEALIRKLHDQMAIRWESYQTRRLPIDPSDDTTGLWGTIPTFISDYFVTPGTPNDVEKIASRLLLARYELMRAELPDHYSDFDSSYLPPFTPQFLRAINPVTGNPEDVEPSVTLSYVRRVERLIDASDPAYADRDTVFDTIRERNQSAECLYLILTTNLGSDAGAVFSERDTGDTDGDGMPEFVDAWGNPIEWIRWPAGFISDLQPATVDTSVTPPTVTRNIRSNPNPFDIQRIDPPPAAFDYREPRGYSLFPLIVSSGPDDEFGLAFRWNPEATARSDPYALHDPPMGDTDDSPRQRGETLQFRRETMDPKNLYFNDLSGDSGYNGYELDNIHNHQLNN